MGNMEIKKKVIYIVLVIMFIFFVCSLFYYDKPKSELPFDELFEKQWYLQKDFTGIIENMDNIQNSRGEGFSVDTSVTINSSVDLGLETLLKQNAQKKDKHITIALIDSCVDISHEDLYDSIWNNEKEIPNNGIDDDNNGFVDDYYGWNFITNSPYVDQDIATIEHGTHCAGIIAAKHNGIGIQGILGNYNVDLMILPILDKTDNKCGNIEIKRLVSAIKYAEKMGASICNISCTFPNSSKQLEKCIRNSDMYFVVAAGNYEKQFVHGINLEKKKLYPASYNYDNIITVASVDCEGELSDFSNYGSKIIDICAPGEYIFSTLPHDKYGFQSGTSMATPIVTSIIAAYYLNYDIDISEAVVMMNANAVIKKKLKEKTGAGKIVYLKQ